MEYKFKTELIKYLSDMELKKEIPKESMKRYYEPSINHFIKYLGNSQYWDTPTKSISVHIIMTYFESLNGRNTDNRFRSLSLFFNYLYKEYNFPHIFLNININKYLEVKPSVTKNITQQEFEKLRVFISDTEFDIKDRLMLGLIVLQGLSKAEILLLRRSDIDLDFRRIYTRKTEEVKMKDKLLLKKTAELISDYVTRYKPNQLEFLFDYKNKADAKFNRDIGKLTYKIIGKKISPKNLREALRIYLIEIHKNEIFLISKFFDESITTTIGSASKFDIITNEYVEKELRVRLDNE